MNNMKNQDVKPLRDVAQSVGNFIRHWGFRRIHGEIWALLYLSKTPMSCTQLVQLLDVSKALVSPALKELQAEGLIDESISENAKVKRYVAIEDVGSVIRRVVKTRESKMIDEAQNAFQKLNRESNHDLNSFVNPERALLMGRMIETAQLGVAFILGTENLWS
jgi:DNA-binding transcriptional regulator GbsR (MarR family)